MTSRTLCKHWMSFLLCIACFVMYSQTAYAIDITLAQAVELLREAFPKQTALEPNIEVNNDECLLTLEVVNLPGVFGNAVFSQQDIVLNSFWKGSLTIRGREGFVNRDILEVSGSVTHLMDFCDRRDFQPGPPLSFLVPPLDLNEPDIRGMIQMNQLTVSDPTLPKSEIHIRAAPNHLDTLEFARVRSNIFDDQTEIGLSTISVRASHVPVPEPSTLCLISLGLGRGLYRWRQRRTHAR